MSKKTQSYSCDFLIVGQGLAGSLMAWRLWHTGARIMVVDPGGNNASKVAAGLVSPVTGKRWVKMRQVDELLHQARRTYRRLETELGIRLWFEHKLLRLHQSRAESSLSKRRAAEPGYRDFLAAELEPGCAGHGLADDFGGRWIEGAAHLATTPLLESLRSWLEERNALRSQAITYADLKVGETGIQWRDVRCDFVIFCEGWKVIHNPWFASLPWQPSAGEILTLESPDPLPPHPVNRGIWLLPEGKGRIRIGATYRWHPLDEAPCEEGVGHLLASFRKLFHTLPRYRCQTAAAGVRPNTLDHHPMVGAHPRFPRLILANGFGSKGTLYAPWCSEKLTEHLTQGHPLPPEISIEQYLERKHGK